MAQRDLPSDIQLFDADEALQSMLLRRCVLLADGRELACILAWGVAAIVAPRYWAEGK